MKTSLQYIVNFFLRTALLCVLWWVITDGAITSWIIGLPLALIAAHVSLALQAFQQHRMSWISLLKFVPFFLFESMRGGLDVARRVSSRRMPLMPGFLNYPLCLPEGTARVFFAVTVSLLPGTLSARFQNNVLCLHVLDQTGAIYEELEALELRVGKIFGVDVSPAHIERNNSEAIS